MTAPLDRYRQNGWRIFRWPLAIGIASVVGLVSALVGDGWYDAASWLLLGSAALLIGWLLMR
jgi:uncharacterized membrane protein YjjP (DUF1212 family)